MVEATHQESLLLHLKMDSVKCVRSLDTKNVFIYEIIQTFLYEEI